MNQLLAFYLGTGTDHRGRTLAEILRQDDLWFEITHDFIQWLFPLNELSRASLHAPLVDGATLIRCCATTCAPAWAASSASWA